MYESGQDAKEATRYSSDSTLHELVGHEHISLLPPYGSVRPWRAASSRLLCSALWLLSVSIAAVSSWILATKAQAAQCATTGHTDHREYSENLFAGIDRSYQTKWFSPFNYSTSPYTEDPRTSNVDVMWHGLGLDTANFVIPYYLKDEFLLDERRHVLIPADKTGTGEPAFIGWFEVLHQLHCLNDLRQSMWYNRDFYKGNPNHGHGVVDDNLEIAHNNHCLDALRERIMCLADIDVVPSLWIHRDGTALPDFERPHQCHDFGAVREWAHRYGMKAPFRYVKFLPPQDAIYTDLHPHV